MTTLARIGAGAATAAILVAGCGGSHSGTSGGSSGTSGGSQSAAATSAKTKPATGGSSARSRAAAFTPAERRAIAAQRHAQRAQFSTAALGRSVTHLRGKARRRAVLRAVDRAILRDELHRYATHELDKRAKYVTCSVSADDQPLVARNPSAPVVRYECLAVTFRVNTKPPTVAGIDFVARVNFATPSFAWCLFVPVGGEGAHAAATLMAPPPPACIADPPR